MNPIIIIIAVLYYNRVLIKLRVTLGPYDFRPTTTTKFVVKFVVANKVNDAERRVYTFLCL